MEINTLGVKPRENCCPHAIIQNFINFDFTVSNQEAAKKMFLPDPLMARADEDGDVILTCGFVDSAFPPLRESDSEEIPDPNTTEFSECALGMSCTYNGKPNIMNTWILLDHYAGALRRGFNRSVIDTFQRTRNHPMLEGDEHIHVGSRMFATCCNDGALYARATLDVKEVKPSSWLDKDFFEWGQLRYLPDMAHGDDVRPLIQQASLYHFPSKFEVSDVYVGDGKLEFGDTLYGAFKDLGEIKVKRAFFVTFAYTYGSEELLCDCEAKKK